MMHGPYKDWHEAVSELLVKRKLVIVNHDWSGGKLYVEAVPAPVHQQEKA